MSEKAVFYDASLRRWQWAKRIGMAMTLAAVALTALFLVSLLLIPVLRPVPGITAPLERAVRPMVPHLPSHRRRLQKMELDRIRSGFYAKVSGEKQRQRSAAGGKIAAAFYATWQETGLHSLKAHADRLTHLMPEWLHLTADGAGLDLYDWNPAVIYHNREVVDIARKNRLAVLPVLNNARGGSFDPERAHLLLASPALQERLAASLAQWLKANGFQGVNVDLENLRPGDAARYPAFLARLGKTLRREGLLLSADIEADAENLDWHAIGSACDFVVLMAYDEHYAGSAAGPLASFSWYERLIRRALATLPPEKLVIGLGNYAYDWQAGKAPASSLTFQQALIRARDNRPGEKPASIVDFDAKALNPTFSYEDDDGRYHEVWFLDAVAALDQWLYARNRGAGGAALWVLGSEDPSIWSFLDRGRLAQRVDEQALGQLSYPYDIEFIGEGDVLKVKSLPQKGGRRLDTDPQTGLVTDETYEEFPSAFVFERNGLVDRAVALTFDDGPSEPYTARILDRLRKYRVPGTFFLIGENLERHPDLVERIWKEGHEIGNHSYTHPDMGSITERRTRLELNGTQRALQSVLGRSTLFFRPPFNADAEPSSAEEVLPVINASKLGYLTIGEFIDPQDWNPVLPLPDGTVRRRTARDIADEIIAKVRTGHGNTILLHDGGGDRSATVEALDYVIPELRKEGYRFVSVSSLIGATREAVMPAITSKDSLILGADRTVFEINYLVELFLQVAFLAAIVLGTLRMAFVVTLALLQRRREKRRRFDDAYRPAVSVLIAAYNERPVIVRTVEAVLAGDYAPLEVIVVDDGSSDGTGDAVAERFGHDPRVRLLRQENAGKAAALNNATAAARGEVLVSLDADTLFARDTVRMLVRRFADPAVGAVAGNVKVGNRINILTYWQTIEYVTSQNLDRRAYALLNAVTVIPGAVGAWRRAAVLAAGGYRRDTLAEDMDLTWRIREAGWKLETESEALGYTETPDTLAALFKQRFRWCFGTLQCLWKHRRMLGRHGGFGRVMLPSMWLFQILFQLLSPVVDLLILGAVAGVFHAWLSRGIFQQDWQPLSQALAGLSSIGLMYAFFFVIELIGSAIAFHIERERKGPLWWLFWQRFVYRQLMYAVVFKSFKTALHGVHAGWGKLERKNTASAGGAAVP